MSQNEIHPQLFAVGVIQRRPLALLVRLPLDALIVGVQIGVVRVLHQACDFQKRAIKNEANRNVGNVCGCVFICVTGEGSVKAAEREVEEARKGRKMPAYLVLA